MKFTSGLPETACGKGSTLKETINVRAELERLIRVLDIKVLLDAPCGDRNWISRVPMENTRYIGVDNDPAHLAKDPPMLAKSVATMEMDIIEAFMPKADLMLCRDFLQHIRNEDIERVLAKVNAEYFLATNHEVPVNRDLKRRGGFRPVNLCRPPFALPVPEFSIEDGVGRKLSLWRMN